MCISAWLQNHTFKNRNSLSSQKYAQCRVRFHAYSDSEMVNASKHHKMEEANFLIGKKSENLKLDNHTRPMQSDFGCSRQQRLDSICTKCWHYWEGNCSKTNSSTAPCYRNLHFFTSKSNCFPLTRQKNAVILRTFVEHTHDFSAAFYYEKLASATAISVVFPLAGSDKFETQQSYQTNAKRLWM